MGWEEGEDYAASQSEKGGQVGEGVGEAETAGEKSRNEEMEG